MGVCLLRCRGSRSAGLAGGVGVPQLLSNFQRRYFQVCPPRRLVAVLVQLMMMFTTQRDREFVAHLSPHGFRLREFQVVRIAGRFRAYEAWLRAHKEKMRFASPSHSFVNRPN